MEASLIENAKYPKITWDRSGLVMYLDGHAWTALVDNGKVSHLWLGTEADVRAVLEGHKPVNQVKHAGRRNALTHILNVKEVAPAPGPKVKAGRIKRRPR